LEAYYKQVEYFVALLRKYCYLAWSTEIANSPMSGLRAAMLFEDCIPSGLTSREGGLPLSGGKGVLAWHPRRGGHRGQLAAMKLLVFDEKKITMAELMDAIEKNWEGCEEIRQMCLNAPKYGNDDEYVDSIYHEVALKIPELMQRNVDPITGKKPLLFVGAAAATSHRRRARRAAERQAGGFTQPATPPARLCPAWT
jgi:formate C-acetyltransferase